MTTDTGTFSFSRRYGLPPARLWHVLTDPKMRERWGAPDATTVLVVDRADLREDGQDRHRCGPAEAPDFVVDTRWYRLDAPHLAVFTETLTIGADRLATSLVTYRLEAEGDGDGSALEIAVAVSSFAGPEVPAEFGGGWEGGLANLDRLVADLLAGRIS